MNLPFIPSNRRVRELEHDLIVANTAALLWEDIARDALKRAKSYRPTREPRRDKASILAAKQETTARLMQELGLAHDRP